MAFRKMVFRSLIFYTVIQLIDGQHLPNSLLLREQTKGPVAFSAVRTANVDRETFLTQSPSQFPKPTLDGKVNAAEFLAASDHLAKFFGLLGSIIAPLQSDIAGNVRRVRSFVEQNPGKVFYINDIFLMEASSSRSQAISSLLWLTRTLEFTMLFLENIVSDTKRGTIKEDLRPLCLQAYEKSLKKHHGWIMQQVFYLASRACPWRRDLIARLALGKPGMESIVLAQIEDALGDLKKNVFIINELYIKYNL